MEIIGKVKLKKDAWYKFQTYIKFAEDVEFSEKDLAMVMGEFFKTSMELDESCLTLSKEV